MPALDHSLSPGLMKLFVAVKVAKWLPCSHEDWVPINARWTWSPACNSSTWKFQGFRDPKARELVRLALISELWGQMRDTASISNVMGDLGGSPVYNLRRHMSTRTSPPNPNVSLTHDNTHIHVPGTKNGKSLGDRSRSKQEVEEKKKSKP